MRRAIAAGLILLGLLAGIARAALLTGTPRADLIVGTPAPDLIDARGGDDRISTAWDDRRDVVACGPGIDVVNADLRDAVAADCETVSRRLARYTVDFDYGQDRTQVEPDSFSWGSKIVAVFQVWRIADGGAAALGWATSSDGGAHWRSGTLPQDGYAGVSDAVVAYDAAHHVWLAVGLGNRGRAYEVYVARSPDGLTWSGPVVAANDVDEAYDKEWVACDNGARSPFRGHCYLAYVDTKRWWLSIRKSVDGGQTWSKPLRIQPGVTGATFSGPVPVTRPNGDLVVPYSFFAPIDGEDRVAAVISHDGGATFSQSIRVAALMSADTIDPIRAPALPAADADAAGRLFVAWQDARFRSDSGKNDIVWSSSANGTTWTEPAKIPLPSDRTYFLPALAADPATSGKTAHLAVAYYSMRLRAGCEVFVPGCYQELDAWLVESRDGGRTWGLPVRINAESMQLEWLADTTLGRMLGDYISVSFVKRQAVPVLTLSGQPSAGAYDEAIFAAQVGR